ncbi:MULTISPECIES: response regulator [unclassified Flavobacterium]|uniref:response regulator n=1 Tax=unclassified Flavobacterium TaxID=196869 RepID=UPI001570B7DC|nr:MULTISPECIES: response regulator [unclassified Flavobacterium]MBE0391374.1 hypothetical protein [Flavobacterium sp. PL002]NRT15656.1 DNA-binding response OmpR family regulator [Flavobacterium sp. 28A]
MKEFNILLVENNTGDAKTFQDFFLDKNQYTVVDVAKDSIEAWTMLRELGEKSTLPKILIIDCDDDYEDEINLIKKIREDVVLKSTLIFILKKSGNESFRSVALNLNVAAYIHKPLNEEKMNDFFVILYDYLDILEFSRATKLK